MMNNDEDYTDEDSSDVDSDSQTDSDFSEEELTIEERLAAELLAREELRRESFRNKISNIIIQKEKTEKEKFKLISEEYNQNPDLFLKSIIKSEYTKKSGYTNLYIYSDIHHLLSLSIYYGFFSVTKFFLDLSQASLVKEQIIFLEKSPIDNQLKNSDLSEKKAKLAFDNKSRPKMTNFLGSRELGQKATKPLFTNQMTLDMMNLMPDQSYLSKGNKLSLLSLAARFDFQGHIVKLLIGCGADLNLTFLKNPKSAVNSSPRHWSSYHNSHSIHPTHLYATALSEAIRAKNKKSFDVLIDHPNIDLHKTLLSLYQNDAKDPGALVTILANKIDDIEKFHEDGLTLLHMVFVTYRARKILEIMLKRNPEYINIRTNIGNTMLHTVFLTNDLFEGVKCLLELGIDVNAQNNYGDTALHFLANIGPFQKRRLRDLITLLLTYGADPQIENHSGQTVFAIASEESRIALQCFHLFNKINNVILDQTKGEMEKIEFIKKEHAENPELIYEIFLSKQLDTKDLKASTLPYLLKALTSSINCKLFNVTKFLLFLPELLFDRLENLKAENQNIYNLVVDKDNLWESCLLKTAIENDDTGLITGLLMDYGFDVNSSINLNKLDVYTFLELAIRSNNRNSALTIANYPSLDPVPDLLEFLCKTSLNNLELDAFMRLLARNDDLNRKILSTEYDIEGDNFLLEAAKVCKNSSLLERLITEKKLNLEAKTNVGMTVLHIALSQGSADTVRLLLRLGAPLDSRNNSDLTPFDLMILNAIQKPIFGLANISDSYLAEFIIQIMRERSFESKITILLEHYSGNASNQAIDPSSSSDIAEKSQVFWQNIQSIVLDCTREALQKPFVEILIDHIEYEEEVDDFFLRLKWPIFFAIDKAWKEVIMEVSTHKSNSIKREIGYVDNHNLQQKPTKMQRY